MPAGGDCGENQRDQLTADQIEEIVAVAIKLGLDKIRITGGEPLLREDILDIVGRVGRLAGLRELCMTTNGILLAEYAGALREAGVNRVNVSLDTLNPGRYREMTGGGTLDQALRGIDAAESAGIVPVRINVVLMGGVNDREIVEFVHLTRDRVIDVRFIELMPIGEGGGRNAAHFISGDIVLDTCPELMPINQSTEDVAQFYQLPDGMGRVGLITPISRPFCGRCNRVRVTADGKLKPCLHGGEEISLVGLSGAVLEETMRAVIFEKPKGHCLGSDRPGENRRNMYQIGG